MLSRACYQNEFLFSNILPLQYVLEEWDFHQITLKMRPPVFIPRPETEELVDIVLSHTKHHVTESGRSDVTVFEVGCGSGAISLALASACSKIKCIAIDKSVHAVRLARENADRLCLGSRVEIYHAELLADGSIFTTESFHSLGEQPLDVIVSNPPYIKTDEKDKLDPEVCRFEDHNALFGGHDGLNIIRSILKFSLGHLKSKGQIFLEVGLLHPPIIRDILNSKEYQALRLIKVHPDFTKRERFIHLLLETAFQK
ncbi:MTRF1L release factor glutamine methyltransferase-like isoform X2 [Ornithodoros turicata]|uniref:MTRF1L release factor glutamine methyltransferase-like isoform X2 n=1 Tax=Ornithodoros turicata TaxID=34597 RepID=UPI00313A3C30